MIKKIIFMIGNSFSDSIFIKPSNDITNKSSNATWNYKAFISYSRAADGELAPALQSALHSFAKPWYHRRAIRVFRDQTNLSANPDLWASIENALNQSEYFIYLASPKAAQSKWVRKEVSAFLEKNSSEKILIVLTDGSISWNEDNKDFDWSKTDAFPNLSRKIFRAEPTWVDLSWAKKESLSQRDPKFLDVIATLSSALRGIDKDELIGEDVKEQRKAKRFRILSFSGLTLLTIGMAVAAALAINEQKKARQRLIRSYVANGVSLMEAGNLASSLPWFLEALEEEKNNTTRRATHLFQITNIIQQIPMLIQVWTYLDPIITASFMPDGKSILIVSGDKPSRATDFEYDCENDSSKPCRGTIYFLDMATGKLLTQAIKHPRGIKSVEISPKGNLLASLGIDDTIRMWNTRSGRLLWQRPGQRSAMTIPSLEFNFNGDKLLIATDSSIQVCHAQQGKVIAHHPDKIIDFSDVQFDKVSDQILYIENRQLYVWDFTKNLINKLSLANMNVVTYTLSPDARRIIINSQITQEAHNNDEMIGSESKLIITTFDSTRKSLKELKYKLEDFESINAFPQFNRASTKILVIKGDVAEGGVWNQGVKVWDADSRATLIDWIKSDIEILDSNLDSTGKHLIIASYDGTASVWRVGEYYDDYETRLKFILNHDRSVFIAKFSVNGQYILTADDNNVIRLWKMPSAYPEVNLDKFNDNLDDLQDVYVTPELDIYIGDINKRNDISREYNADEEKIVYIVNPKNNLPIGRPLKHQARVRCAKISPDGQYVITGSVDGTAMIWRVNDQEPILKQPLRLGSSISAVAFSPDSRFVAAASLDNTARVWDTFTGTGITPVLNHGLNPLGNGLNSIDFLMNGTCVRTINDNSTRLWDVSTGQPLLPIELNSPSAYELDEDKTGANKVPITQYWGKLESWSIDDFRQYIELISYRRIDEAGALVPLDSSNFNQGWKNWVQRHNLNTAK